MLDFASPYLLPIDPYESARLYTLDQVKNLPGFVDQWHRQYNRLSLPNPISSQSMKPRSLFKTHPSYFISTYVERYSTRIVGLLRPAENVDRLSLLIVQG